jgi:hypothetical protein
MSKQITAVEWLEEQTRTQEWHSLKREDILDQAKEMEKQQIVESHFQGVKSSILTFNKYVDIPTPSALKDIKDIESGVELHDDGIKYYNKTFKQ